MNVLAVVSLLVVGTVLAAADVPQFYNPTSPFSQPQPVYPTIKQTIPTDSSKNAKILRYDSESNIGNGFQYSVETSDGQIKEEQAVFENAGTKDESLSVVGRFLYPGLNGEFYETKYIADKDGFRAEGAHLPQPVQPVQ